MLSLRVSFPEVAVTGKRKQPPAFREGAVYNGGSVPFPFRTGRRKPMNQRKKVPGQRKPTGQEMDQEYDELHTRHDGDIYPTRKEERQQKEEELHEYIEGVEDPD
jgi:hypothetical protein